MTQLSEVHGFIQAGQKYHIGKSEIKGIAQDGRVQRLLGLGVSNTAANNINRFAMDADLTPTLTTPSINTPTQFLQQWLPGVVNVVTQALCSDDIMSTLTIGSWEDEEVVQQIVEWTADGGIYGDHTQIPLSSYNVNFERRTNIRFELGVEVHRLEDARAARQQISAIDQKRAACARQLNILRNSTSFFGYADGTNRTFGILSDPNLPGYINSPAGGSGLTTFASKTVNERIASLLILARELLIQSGKTVDPMRDKTVLVLPLGISTTFLDINEFGVSVKSWLAENLPLCRVESVPEFVDANGGESVIYMMAESVPDSGTDDGEVITQLIPTKLFLLGSMQLIKGWQEGYTNATAGVLVKRPFATVRMTGV